MVTVWLLVAISVNGSILEDSHKSLQLPSLVSVIMRNVVTSVSRSGVGPFDVLPLLGSDALLKGRAVAVTGVTVYNARKP